MGVAYFPAFEHEIDGFDPSVMVSGKPVARSIEQLDVICKNLGVTPLSDFYSESNEEAFQKIGEAVPPGLRDEPIRWSEPEQGLRSVAGVLAYLRKHPDELCDTREILRDLDDLRKVLAKAQECGVRFRLRIDV